MSDRYPETVWIADEEGGGAVAVCLTLSNSRQVWSGEVSRDLFEKQAAEAQAELGDDCGAFVIISLDGLTEILARATDCYVAMDIAQAYGEWAQRHLDRGVKLPPQPDEAREGSQSPDDGRDPGLTPNPSFSKAEGRTP